MGLAQSCVNMYHILSVHRQERITFALLIPYTPRFIRELPDSIRHTYRYDSLSSIAWGAMASGGAATAAVVAKKALGATNFEIALLYSANGVGLLATVFLAGWMHRHRALPFVIWPEIVTRLGFIAVAFTVTSWPFILCMCIAYAVGSTKQAAVARIYKSNYPDDIRGRVFAVVRRGTVIVHLVSAQIIGSLLDAHPDWYGLIYPVLGFIGLAGTLSLSRIRVVGEGKINEKAHVNVARGIWHIITTDKPFMVFILVWWLFGFAISLNAPVKAIYLTDPAHGISASYSASLMILVIIPSIVIIFTIGAWGRALDRIPVATLRIPQLLFATISAVLWIYADSIWILGIAALFMGAAGGGGQIMGSIGIFEFARTDNVSLYVSVHTTLLGIRFLIAPQVGRALLEAYGPQYVFWISVFLSGLSVILMALLARGMKSRGIGRYGSTIVPDTTDSVQ